VGKEPDEIRAEIERTRQELGQDVDLLTEKMSPTRVVERRVERAKGAVGGVKERIMGSASEGASSAGDRISSATSTVGSAAASVRGGASAAPDVVRRRAEGNPLAAGVIAFGVGWLVSSLLPTTEREQQAASQVKEKAGEVAQPVAEELRSAATDVKENLQEPAQQAVQSVKETATEAAGAVREQTKSASSDVADTARSAQQTVREETRPGGSSL
jgi:hypothetical protein